MRQNICGDLHWVGRVGATQKDVAAAFRSHDPAGQCPAKFRQVESGRGLRGRPWRFTLAGLNVWCMQTWVALPEKGRLTPSVARRQRLLVLPDTREKGVILQVLTDPRQVLHDGDAVSLQLGLPADT